jgi:hypothetical protein
LRGLGHLVARDDLQPKHSSFRDSDSRRHTRASSSARIFPLKAAPLGAWLVRIEVVCARPSARTSLAVHRRRNAILAPVGALNGDLGGFR